MTVLHCALISLSADWALLDCVTDRKVRDVISEAILSPSERYQNIQDNLEYNSVLPFRIILKIFAVNMLYHYGSQKPDVSIFFCIRYKRCMSSSAINEKQASACLFFTSCTRWRTFSVVVGSDEQLLAFYLAVHNGLSKKKSSLSSSRRKKTSLSRVWMWVRSSVITSVLSFSELLLPKLLLLLLANLCLISLTIWDFKC